MRYKTAILSGTMIMAIAIMIMISLLAKRPENSQQTYETNDLTVIEVMHDHGSNTRYFIMIDEVTGSQYIVVQTNHGVAITPRYDGYGDIYFPYEFEVENQ